MNRLLHQQQYLSKRAWRSRCCQVCWRMPRSSWGHNHDWPCRQTEPSLRRFIFWTFLSISSWIALRSIGSRPQLQSLVRSQRWGRSLTTSVVSSNLHSLLSLSQSTTFGLPLAIASTDQTNPLAETRYSLSRLNRGLYVAQRCRVKHTISLMAKFEDGRLHQPKQGAKQHLIESLLPMSSALNLVCRPKHHLLWYPRSLLIQCGRAQSHNSLLFQWNRLQW